MSLGAMDTSFSVWRAVYNYCLAIVVDLRLLRACLEKAGEWRSKKRRTRIHIKQPICRRAGVVPAHVEERPKTLDRDRSRVGPRWQPHRRDSSRAMREAMKPSPLHPPSREERRPLSPAASDRSCAGFSEEYRRIT